MKVSIVIPNWNGRELLEKNFASLVRAAAVPVNGVIEIIMVDDASTDDSVEYVKKNFEKVRLFVHKKNRGFSESVNMGVRHAKGELVCLLNTDVAVSRYFLRDTIGLFRDKSVFGVSLHEQGFGPGGAKFRGGYLSFQPGKEMRDTQKTFWISGGSGVFRRDIWMDLKGLDVALYSPFYWEDLDISYRATKRGYKLLWEPLAKVKHNHEGIVNKSNFDMKQVSLIKERNELLFIWKNITSKSMFRKHLSGLARRAVSHPGYLRVVFMAMRKYRAVMKARRGEAKSERVSDEAIFGNFE